MDKETNRRLAKKFSQHKQLIKFYDDLSVHFEHIVNEIPQCGTCSKCCQYPYFYMTLHLPEFQLIRDYIDDQKIAKRVHFEVYDEDHPDKRVYFKDWICPLYSWAERKCLVYPVRPLSCRVYGPYARANNPIENCVWKDPVIYDSVKELPFWEEYEKILLDYPECMGGYIFPDSTLYQYPILEFLMGYEFPWSFAKNYSPRE